MVDEPLEILHPSTFEQTANMLAAAFNGFGHQEFAAALDVPLAYLALGYITTYATQVLHIVWSLPNGPVGPINIASLKAYTAPGVSGWVQLRVARKEKGHAGDIRRTLSVTYSKTASEKDGQYNPLEFSYRNIDRELVGQGNAVSPLLGNHPAHYDPENERIDGDCETTLRIVNDGLRYVMPYSGQLRVIGSLPISVFHSDGNIIFSGSADDVHLKTPFQITFPSQIGFSPTTLQQALALVPK